MTFWTMLAVTAALVAQDAPSGAPPSPAAQAAVERPFDDRSVTVHGQVSVLADVLPKQDATELRPRLSLSLEAAPTAWSRVRFDARTEALAADRSGRTADVVARVTEAWFEVANEWADVRAGVGRLAWGRLDEISPADVVNPIDASRFLLEGRSEARLPVALVRARVFPSERLTIEGVAVPVFARGRFDELDEPTSPFNLIRDAVLPAGANVLPAEPIHSEPDTAWRNMSGGGRVQLTVGRVDVTGSVFRGFDGFGPITFEVVPAVDSTVAVVGRLVEHHTRFTMVAGDVEAVAGRWAWRGEVVGMVEKTFAGRSVPGLVSGRSVDVGAGFDRRAGDYRLYGSLVIHREWSRSDPAITRTDVNAIGSVERSLGRDRYVVRTFAVVNPAAASAFLRGVLLWRATDQASLEGSAGAFLGSSDDRIGQFQDRDFAFLRFKYDF